MKKTPLAKRSKKHSSSWWRKKRVEEAKKIALERDSYSCQKCGKSKEAGYAIHGSHVYPEGTYHNISADPLNIKALCYQCHFNWWHKHPTEAGLWFRKTFPERYEYLKMKSLESIKINWQTYSPIEASADAIEIITGIK